MTSREQQIFNAIENLLTANINMESVREKHCQKYSTGAIHQYAKELCESLLKDVKKLERKYRE